MERRLAALAFAIIAAAMLPARAAPVKAHAASEPFLLDAGRVLVTLMFRAAGGRDRPVLAWLNMGTPRAALSPGLRHDLGLGAGAPLRFRLGAA